ncbi:MAG: BON domain-containing protein [Bryobacteraceae bacterium]
MRTIAVVVICSGLALAQAPTDRGRERIERAVRSEVLKLPYYGPFDWITFQLDGYKVTLNGLVSRPTLKTDSERVVKKIEGVESVTNNIEVLPLSPNDDRLRNELWRAILGHPTMLHYAIRGPNSPIHILVKNGNVWLEGYVAFESEKNIAGLQANGVPGVFKVTNNLQVDAPAVKKMKVKMPKKKPSA